MNVLLNYACPLLICSRLLNQRLYLIKILKNRNPLTAISVLPRFNNPYVPLLRCLCELCLLLSPLPIVDHALRLLLPPYLLLFFDVVRFEPRELRVLEALLYVKRDRDSIKHVLPHGLVVEYDVLEHGFLVALVKVVLKFVVKFYT
jgi:hypothetical protein